MSELLTVEQLLEQIPISRRKLQDHLNARELATIKLGRRLYFRQVDIDSFIEARRTPAREPVHA